MIDTSYSVNNLQHARRRTLKYAARDHLGRDNVGRGESLTISNTVAFAVSVPLPERVISGD